MYMGLLIFLILLISFNILHIYRFSILFTYMYYVIQINHACMAMQLVTLPAYQSIQWQPVARPAAATATVLVHHPHNVAVTTNLPKYALFISAVTTMIFAGVLFWIPGLFCLIPAIGTAIAVS